VVKTSRRSGSQVGSPASVPATHQVSPRCLGPPRSGLRGTAGTSGSPVPHAPP
jgi:hypothetical protein